MSYIKYLKENLNGLEFIYSDDIESEDSDAAYKLAEDEGINILRDKELYIIVKDGNTVVGGLWTSWDNPAEEFSFDVATDINYGKMGIGSKLVDEAITQFNNDSEAFENPIMKIQVVSHIMEKMLEKRNFEVVDKINNSKIMIRK